MSVCVSSQQVYATNSWLGPISIVQAFTSSELQYLCVGVGVCVCGWVGMCVCVGVFAIEMKDNVFLNISSELVFLCCSVCLKIISRWSLS